NHLKKIPVNRIKIDKKYIKNIHNNRNDAAIVKSLIILAERLNLQILAEGVETFMQLQSLLSQQCKEIQGYYFSKPLPAEEVEKLLKQTRVGC
ncbi:MAG: EAL domain-containing protein, partial [Gammaproteobacteria bacterium]|nr:EAL domain-containing protein [Gammaproteobacteria bacterium]